MASTTDGHEPQSTIPPKLEAAEQNGGETTVVSTGPHIAPPPFNKPTADLILRTPDNMEFLIYKCILAEVSPVFADMFTLPPAAKSVLQPKEREVGHAQGGDSSDRAEIPVVEVSEHSNVLEPLLRSFWPPAHYKLPSLDVLKPVLAAGHKYQMDEVLLIFMDHLKLFARDAPLRVYALAARYDMWEVMQYAARCFLTLPSAAADAYVDELADISRQAYYQLLAYRRACVAALRELLGNLSWLGTGGWTFVQCTYCPRDFQQQISVWMSSHYERITAVLLERPCREAIQDVGLCEQALKEATQCNVCRQVVHNHMQLFMENLRNALEDELAMISLGRT